jgi:hypothetical protein
MKAVKKGPEPRRETGQVLILFVFALAALIGFMALATDVGLFMHERQNVQNVVDAAALAGAQSLPDDGNGAKTLALQYAQANDNSLTPSQIDVTFRCLVGDRNGDGQPDSSDIPAVCNPGSNGQFVCSGVTCVSTCVPAEGDKCNVIVVGANKNVPFFFAPVLSVFGGNACLNQCPTGSIRAAACRGSCGGPPTAPLDVVEVIDRTGSMSSTDLTNAKNAAKSVLQLYNPSLQHVGLAVLGSSDSSNYCADALNAVWLPVPLSSDYQNGNGSLNTSSPLVSTINCLLTSSTGTNLGSPAKAATNQLTTNGRAGVTKGIIFMTDGEANAMETTTANSGYLNCGANAAVTSGSGDNNGFETTAASACADGGGEAQDANSGTGTSTSCTNSGKDRHTFSNYGISIPGGATFSGIDVRLDARISSASGTRFMCVELSWNGGSSWTSAKQTSNLGTSAQTYTLGSGSDNWGHAWSASDLSNANFRVRVTDVADSTSRTFYLDWAAVRVYWSAGTAALGPCDYAVKQAAAAKALNPPIEVFTIGFGVAGATCQDELPGSAYVGALATKVLADMATNSLDDKGHCANASAITAENADGDHFLCEAKTGDLTPIFMQAAAALSSGIRLVPVPN